MCAVDTVGEVLATLPPTVLVGVALIDLLRQREQRSETPGPHQEPGRGLALGR